MPARTPESREYRKGAFLYQLSETQQSEETNEMHSVATRSAVFQQREVVRAETPEQTYNYAAILPDRRFHDRMRPAATFLSLLGGSDDEADVCGERRAARGADARALDAEVPATPTAAARRLR